MRKIRTLLLIVVISFFIYSCNNEAQTNFEQIQTEFQSLNFNSPDAVDFFIDKIDNHLNRFPDYDRNSELIQIKKKLNDKIEQAIFEEIKGRFQESYSQKYQGYDEAIEKFNQLKTVLNDFIEHTSNTDNSSTARNYIDQLNTSLNSINNEKQAYYNAVNSNNVYEIEEFLSNFPNSVMRGSLLDKIDEIYFSEFTSSISMSVNTIPDVNKNVSIAKDYLQKIKNLEAKSQVSEIISNLENQRRPILETELNDKLQDLIIRMEREARDRAEQKRPTYTVEMCVPRGSNPEIVGYSSSFERVYQVNMKGAFLGIDKRELEVSVSGRITGDLNSGVTISITGARVISDVKL